MTLSLRRATTAYFTLLQGSWFAQIAHSIYGARCGGSTHLLKHALTDASA